MADNYDDDDDDVVADSLSVRQDEPRRGKRTLHELGAGQQPHTHTQAHIQDVRAVLMMMEEKKRKTTTTTKVISNHRAAAFS